MKTYLLTALGVIFLIIIVSFIVPDGKIKKSCNFVLKIICICVLIQPTVGIFNISNTSSADSVDYGYVCSVYSDNQSSLLTRKVCEQFDIDCVCRVSVIFENDEIKENGVSVELNDCDEQTIKNITEYLTGLGYINISVNEKGA